jgi:hypothetical protein
MGHRGSGFVFAVDIPETRTAIAAGCTAQEKIRFPGVFVKLERKRNGIVGFGNSTMDVMIEKSAL